MVNDGLATENLNLVGGSLVATVVSGATLAVGYQQISSAEIGSGTVVGVNISGAVITQTHMAYGKLMTGSPSAYGLSAQAGQGTLTAGSTAWVAFPTAFKAAPYVVCTSDISTYAQPIGVGSSNTGSFFAIGKTASETFSYIAIGSM